MMRKHLAAAGLAAAGLAGGAVAGAALANPGLVGAQDSTTTTAPDVANPDAANPDAAPPEDSGRFEQGLRDALAPLVTDGTIDQSQLDAVVGRLKEAGGEWRREHGPGHHGPGPMFGAAAADALGMTQGELGDALRSGQSIADVAEAQGVDLQTVIDAIVAEGSDRLDQAVADGRLTEEQAAERKAELPDRVAEMVQRTRPDGPPEDGSQD